MSLFRRLISKKKQDRESMKQHSMPEILNDEELLEDAFFEEESEQEAEGVPEDDDAEDPNIEYEMVEREILPAKIICPDCGGITLEGLDYCDKCGGELH